MICKSRVFCAVFVSFLLLPLPFQDQKESWTNCTCQFGSKWVCEWEWPMPGDSKGDGMCSRLAETKGMKSIVTTHQHDVIVGHDLPYSGVWATTPIKNRFDKYVFSVAIQTRNRTHAHLQLWLWARNFKPPRPNDYLYSPNRIWIYL